MPLQKTNVGPPTENCPENTEQIHRTSAHRTPQQNIVSIATLLKSHFGTESTLQTRRLLLIKRPTKDSFWEKNRIYEKKYIFT